MPGSLASNLSCQIDAIFLYDHAVREEEEDMARFVTLLGLVALFCVVYMMPVMAMRTDF